MDITGLIRIFEELPLLQIWYQIFGTKFAMGADGCHVWLIAFEIFRLPVTYERIFAFLECARPVIRMTCPPSAAITRVRLSVVLCGLSHEFTLFQFGDIRNLG
jgi:hypothetical protein